MHNTFLSLLFVIIVSVLSFAQNPIIEFQITEGNNKDLTPAKIVVLQDGSPFEHQLSSNKDLACRGNTIYSRTGTGRFSLPEGTYELYFGKGMEYNVVEQSHRFESGKTYAIEANLIRELNPKGFVGGDMHLHTYTFSGHGDANVEERLISCVAEGLEWAVATDHNEVLDYTPYMEKLGLIGQMATTVGNEVSTPIGHFNTYPLATKTAPINSKIKVGKDLFETIKNNASEDVLIQVNHPRWVATDYFNSKGLDPYFGLSKHPEWDGGFDAFEVLNENFGIGWRDAPDNKFSVKQDWFNLLNQGRRVAGLGNSDSHSVIAQIAGVPRNYIRSSTDIPAEINEQELTQNIKQQQVIVSGGLFPNIIANQKYGVGEEVSIEQKLLSLQLTVQAASWVSCHKAELIENGEVIRTFTIAANEQVLRFDTTLLLRPKIDSWYSLIAYGDEAMAPMVQTKEKPVYPIGFTNPVWVDTNNDGTITSVFEAAEQLVDSLHQKPIYFLAQIRQKPSLVIPAFYHLFTKQPKTAVQLATLYLKQANSRQRLLLYRELAKIGSKTTTSVLMNEKRKSLLPLEEVVLNYYLAFPLTDNKAAKYKKKGNTQLDEQLNWLEDNFRFAYSGATNKTLSITQANSNPNLKEATWTDVELPATSVLDLNTALPDGKGTHYYLHYPLYAKMDTAITFYIHTDAPIKVSNAGTTIQVIEPNHDFPIKGKLIELNLEKGANNLYFQVAAKASNNTCIQEINPDKLLDPALADAVTVAHLALDKFVQYETVYAPKYHGHGVALTDGYRGTTDFKSQLWQGWNGEHAEFIIDLGSEQTIEEVKLGLLADQDSWIFYPTAIHCSFSEDGVNFTDNESLLVDATKRLSKAIIKDIGINFKPLKTRYIKVVAEKLPALPDWHKGKGGAAWICIDEVLVK